MSVVLLNNEQIPVSSDMTIKQLLLAQGMNPFVFMIRVNGQIVNRDQYDTFIIPDGAIVKAYPFVGGG
ncbi:MAG: sulfur carrier protein ThiS [Geobacteraceae bacterium]|nr:sulfur carrier protein ThiS [Geobacteraceae bacterium]